MRSEGQVRFITISSRFQIVAASLATFTVIASAVLFGVAGWTQYRASSDRSSLLDREAKVASAEQRVDAYRDNIDAVASDLSKRQEFIENMVQSLPDDVKTSDPVSDLQEKLPLRLTRLAPLSRKQPPLPGLKRGSWHSLKT